MKKPLLFLLTLVFVCVLSAVPLRILHTNDTHGSYQAQKTKSGDYIGGYINLEYHLGQARSTAARAIYLDAGDQQTGSIFASMTHKGAVGGAVIEAFNHLQLDATTFGNHEFDHSYANTIKLTELANYPFVSTNLRSKQGKAIGQTPYKIIALDSLKIGVMGLTLVELPEKVKRENISELNILPYKQAIDEYIDYVDANSDLVILITHLGFEADSLLATTLDNRIDLIIGGHSHVNIDEPLQVNGIYIASAGSHNVLLGQLDIDVVNDRIASLTTNQIPLWQPKEQPKTKLAGFVTAIADSIQASMGKSIARIPEDWKPDKFKETAVSRWVANSLLAEYQQPYKPDLAIINNGGIRKYIPAGEVTLGDMHELLPFNNYVVVFSCYGRDLLKMDEYNRKNAIDKPYDIVQTAGMKAVNQPCPGGHGHSKKVWEVNQLALEPDTKYRVVSHDYIVGQWDKYLGFQPYDVQETGDLILEAMIKQLILQFGKK